MLCTTLPDDISIYTNKILSQSLVVDAVAEIKFALEGLAYQIPEIMHITMRNILKHSLTSILTRFKKIHLKLDCKVVLLNIEDGSEIETLIHIPNDKVLKVQSLHDLIINIGKYFHTASTETELKDTKWKLSMLTMITMKVSSIRYAGCKGYIKPDNLKSKKCFLSPATDDLCFWKCLGIHFNERKTNKMKSYTKQGCVQQKLDALEFKTQFYSDTRNEHPDIVCEDQYKDIATKFEIRLMIFQLNAQGGAELIHDLNAKSQNICKLHYDADKCHFLYIILYWFARRRYLLS